VVYDPWNPDCLFAALTTGTIMRSDDAGVSWTDLAPGPTGVTDLLLTPGGQALLAATPQGVWRLDV
jgi:hypothetical protein